MESEEAAAAAAATACFIHSFLLLFLRPHLCRRSPPWPSSWPWRWPTSARCLRPFRKGEFGVKRKEREREEEKTFRMVFSKRKFFVELEAEKKKVRSRISRRNSLCLIFLPRRQTRLGTLRKLSSCHARSGSITALGRIAISNSGGGVSSSHAAKRER